MPYLNTIGDRLASPRKAIILVTCSIQMEYVVPSHTTTRPAPCMKQHRAHLRPTHPWLPATCSPRFAADCRRQSAALAHDPVEKHTADFIETVGAWHE